MPTTITSLREGMMQSNQVMIQLGITFAQNNGRLKALFDAIVKSLKEYVNKNDKKVHNVHIRVNSIIQKCNELLNKTLPSFAQQTVLQNVQGFSENNKII